ncbi:MAG: hypothetical protein HFH84_15315 [Lachnospiraceae bacterium]|nr:hypothetical protein [Lachnospiraceae bacterium]
MRKLLKQIKWETVLTSLLYIVLGAVTVAIPETMVRTLGYLVGVLFILVGAVSMICYLLRDASRNYDRNDFGYGLVGIAVGVLFLYKVEWITSLVPVILGVLVLASGCVKLQHVIDMKRLDCGNWVAVLILAVINVIFGVVLIANPFQTVILLFQLVGAGLIFSGITDCITVVYVADRMKEFLDRAQAVDSTFTEVVEEEKVSRAWGKSQDRKDPESGESRRNRKDTEPGESRRDRKETESGESRRDRKETEPGENSLDRKGPEEPGEKAGEDGAENKDEGA